MSVAAYHRARRIVETPRATEHRLVSQITGDIIEAARAGLSGTALMPVLHRNREAWGIFATACAAEGNGLPAPLRASIISIALWVERFTSEVVARREPIDELIEVNRTLLAGLEGEGTA